MMLHKTTLIYISHTVCIYRHKHLFKFVYITFFISWHKYNYFHAVNLKTPKILIGLKVSNTQKKRHDLIYCQNETQLKSNTMYIYIYKATVLSNTKKTGQYNASVLKTTTDLCKTLQTPELFPSFYVNNDKYGHL